MRRRDLFPFGRSSEPDAPDEAEETARELLELLAERQHDVDAAIIAAFGDPGLFARFGLPPAHPAARAEVAGGAE